MLQFFLINQDKLGIVNMNPNLSVALEYKKNEIVFRYNLKSHHNLQHLFDFSQNLNIRQVRLQFHLLLSSPGHFMFWKNLFCSVIPISVSSLKVRFHPSMEYVQKSPLFSMFLCAWPILPVLSDFCLLAIFRTNGYHFALKLSLHLFFLLQILSSSKFSRLFLLNESSIYLYIYIYFQNFSDNITKRVLEESSDLFGLLSCSGIWIWGNFVTIKKTYSFHCFFPTKNHFFFPWFVRWKYYRKIHIFYHL